MPPGGCPEPSALDRLNEGVVSPKDESALVEHLRICQACCRRFGDIVSAWSVATKAQNGRRAPTDADRAILDRLAAYGPEDAVPPPVIEGLSDLVEVGRGGMGVVYRAKEARLGRTVAVKVLHRRSSKEGESLARAEREARLLTKIAHPNVVGILYVTDVDRAPAIVMEWIEGPSLETRAEEGPIPSREAVSIVAAVARGLVAVHAGGVIHRDIKPPNVLLARASDAGGFTPKLVDFGLAMPHGDTEDRVTRASMAVGTPSFMAPEQTGLDPALGPVGPAADVHALGGVLYWLLCGKKPHEGRTTAETLLRAVHGHTIPLRTHAPAIPADLATIVDTCLARLPERRYATAAALLDDLERHLDGRPIQARPAGHVERLVKWSRRRPAMAALAGSAVASTIALTGVVAHHVRSLHAANTAATASRDDAVGAQELARRSFERLTDESAERFLARGAVLDDADRDYLRRIRDEYLAWPLQPDAVTGLRFRADGLMRVARIFERLCWLPDAHDSARSALHCLDELDILTRPTPADETRRDEAEWTALSTLARTGRIDEATDAARQAIARLETRIVVDPSARCRLAAAWANLAKLESMTGHGAAALDLHRRANELFDRLIAEDPGDVRLVRLSLPVLYNAAIDPTPDDTAVRRAMLERLVDRCGDGLDRFVEGRDELGRGLLLGLTALAHLDLAAGEPAVALERVRRRAAAAQDLAAEMPASDHFTGEVVGAAIQASSCHLALGHPHDAEAVLAAAVAAAAESAAAAPAVAARARVLVEVLGTRGNFYAAIGRRDDAIADHVRMLDLLRTWTEDGGRETPADFAAAAAAGNARLAEIERQPSADGTAAR